MYRLLPPLLIVCQIFWANGVVAYPTAICQKLVDEIESKLADAEHNLVDLSVWQVFLHVMKYRFPEDFTCFERTRLHTRVMSRLKALVRTMSIANKSLIEQQAILDVHYFADDKIDFPQSLPKNHLFAYVFYRTLAKSRPNLKPDRDFAALLKKRSKFSWGYYLTHVIFYDSIFFKKPLDAINYDKIITELTLLIPWVTRENQRDLAAEIFLCLSFIGAREGDNYTKLARYIGQQDDDPDPKDVHLRVVTTLAKNELRYQQPRAILRSQSPLGVTQAYLFGREFLKDTDRVVIGINGGPGWSHRALLPLADASRFVPVILYDQLGVGASDQSARINKTYDLDTAVSELFNLVMSLAPKRVILLGHSFGSLIAFEFAKRYPALIEKLILASPFLSPRLWQKVAHQNLWQLPVSQQIINDYFAETLSARDFARLNDAFNHRYVIAPLSRYIKSFGTSNAAIYTRLFGTSEFHVSGTIRAYEPVVHTPLATKTLMLAGEYDTADDASLKYYEKYFTTAKRVIISRGQHLFYLTHLGTFITHLREFLATD